MEAAATVGAILIAIWSAATASRALKHRESPVIDIQFVVARPNIRESESADPWRDPAIRITNNGPYDYDQVIVELMRSPDETVGAQSSPIYSMSPLVEEGEPYGFDKRQVLGPLRVGEFVKLRVVPNPGAHGATVTFRITCHKDIIWKRTWLVGVQLEIPPGPPRSAYDRT